MSVLGDPGFEPLRHLSPDRFTTDGATPGLARHLERTRDDAATLASWLSLLPPVHRAGQHTVRWLEHQLEHLSESGVLDNLPPPSMPHWSDSEVALERWAQHHGVGAWLDARISQLPLASGRPTHPDLRIISDHYSTHLLFSHRTSRGPFLDLRRVALDGMAAIVTMHTAAKEVLDDTLHLKDLEPAAEGLVPWFHAIRQRLLCAADTTSLVLPPQPTVDIRRRAREAIVTLWPTRLPIRVPVDIPRQPPAPPYDEAIVSALLVVWTRLINPDHPDHHALAEAFGAPRWLDALARMDEVTRPPDPDAEKYPHLVWRVVEGDHYLHQTIRPERARRNKADTRWVTRQLRTRDELPPTVDRDELDRVERWRRTPSSRFASFAAELIGHPRVIGPDKHNPPVPVVRATLDLAFEPLDDQIVLVPRLDGAAIPLDDLLDLLEPDHEDHHTAWFDGAALHVLAISRRTLAWLAAWANAEPRIPRDRAAELLRRMPAWSEVAPVHLGAGLEGRRVPGESRPVVRLDGTLDALRLDVWVQPLPDAPAQRPGHGPNTVHGLQGEDVVQVARALGDEPDRVRATMSDLPLDDEQRVGPWTWAVQGAASVLTLLHALKGTDERLRVGWNDRLPVVRRAVTAKDLSLRISSGRDWFGMAGEVELDGLSAPLEALVGHDTPGFVRLTDGSYAVIERELRQSLAAATAGGTDRRGAVRVSPWQAGVVEGLRESGARINAPEAWLDLTHRLSEASKLSPVVPEGLAATLYPYQREGFDWLAKLAHWAPGGVLADDMGLGKTVQALALLLRRAHEGPALVVVPTSLGFNWRDELARFAPSLIPHWFHGSGRTLGDPRPGDVVVTTWGVLVQDIDELSAVDWSTVVFDEAHAIKTPTTQRAQAARRLTARFRLALTGTPLENHLGELWSLFDAIVPGLLGNQRAFHEHIRVPVEQRGDTTTREALSSVIRPFLLRRSKREVALDLPDRTEIVHRIDRSAEEHALYDTARRRAVEAMARSGSSEGRFAMLAALQHLRQLACHPALVDPGSPVRSSKLAHARRLVNDLREEGHQVLVFSQFTRHLDLVQAAFVEDGARCLRLDGSTSAPAREAAVQAFQAGESDVFLISLKAGGVGLNLTAATYVIHLDPWWNPAAEDQATDRAHRIGQSRAVTVIRLVSTGTIEEQILSLHADKRQLATEVLSGTGKPTRIDVDDLRALLEARPG